MNSLFSASFFAQAVENLQDASFSAVALGSVFLGGLAGLSGAFVVTKRLNLLGDVLAHSALPGIALCWILLQSGTEWALSLGAVASIALAWCFLGLLKKRKTLSTDSALSCTLSLFFGLGMVLLSKAARMPGFGEIGVEKLLLGSLATLLAFEIKCAAVLLLLFSVFLIVTWKKLWPTLFDSTWSQVHLKKKSSIDACQVFLSFFVILSIAFALRGLGILLLMTLCVAPAVIARHVVKSFGPMCVFSALIGAIFCFVGAAWSALPSGPTSGPATVFVASIGIAVLCLYNFSTNLKLQKR
jgi:manganese/zinc/iron transport system permease protein